MSHRLLIGLFYLSAAMGAAAAHGHDTWLETNTPLVRVGDAVQIDLKLGNHGNGHRDFKLAGRVSLDWVSAEIVAPSGKRHDIKPRLRATALAEKEGYWSGMVTQDEPGVYCALQQLDRVMKHGKMVRGVRVAKTYFRASPSLDRPSADTAVFARPTKAAVEFVPETDLTVQLGVGRPIPVRLLLHGKPLAGATVSFIPRGHTLKPEFDPEFERRTDREGRATFTPNSANVYLLVAHHQANDEKTAEYEYTHYATTLTVRVPATPLNSESATREVGP